MLKTLDKYIIKMFFPPLLMTFFVAMFVLIMQFFWKYVDEIIGKGLELAVIGELVFYLAMTLVPLAMPIAILISSVMVMGNLSERYELASMKSAGMPLLRVMAPLIFVCFILGLISFFTANYVIPYSNLKFQARLYDIRKQKPALSLQAGVFNDDFKGYTIRIGEKGKDNQTIRDVLIYDQTSNRQQEQIQVLADEGQMYTTADKQFMVLELNEGRQYQSLNPAQSSKKNYPFMRTNFKKWEKVFDMSEFSLSRTDEQLFENHYQMMTGGDLLRAIDSLELKMDEYYATFMSNSKAYFHFRKSHDSIYGYVPIDTTNLVYEDVESFIKILPINKQETSRQKAGTIARRVQEYAYTANSGMTRTKEIIAEHWIWLHRKISFALACFVFIFIGAPMGAIIRKGGFGWPMLIAIFFFMFFIVLFMTGEKMAKQLVVPPYVGIYLPIYVLLPISIFLTYKAMNDSKAFNMDAYKNFFKKIVGLFSKKKDTP